LLNFIEPKHFNSEEKFLEEYGSLSKEDQVKNFKKMLKPYLLRRVKEDVETTIPKLSENIIDVEMSSRQKAYYKGVL
jgi:chromodomain-helicase-DNA-binding protein 7